MLNHISVVGRFDVTDTTEWVLTISYLYQFSSVRPLTDWVVGGGGGVGGGHEERFRRDPLPFFLSFL